ncbi:MULTISPECIES: DUF1156 domain-containing protein [unclassified Streptomyces]|uniref:DUF1156 domain-containing protein n=1 Tax=unclassified Streptomyces TaxID=2593676 RepID=UPI00136945E5|nr:DUF1156 domain-containing protein [Streptomyces sp. SID335]MYZ15817.1 DUF1156 domain-containing protein [Streptomyces sp. SID337]NDZ85282.1 DUF1156 domain-containing protein [Streptomyces sp. SID10115]NDZ99819.1 DUF1156 domain-containing protein [Streptomyces sp. SID10116]NEB49164.1 DUF1156 domain-containing protein [Streptomyces sp. SID339]
MSTGTDNEPTRRRKLIEVVLPTEAISKASKAEKERSVGTVKNIHKWFAPMPTPAWRALLFAAVVDDPGNDAKRAELEGIIKGLVPDNGAAPSAEALKKARTVLHEQGTELPTVLDPFCGGGSTLVEAQRLGFPTVASDLNPVPTLVTRVETQLVPSVLGKPAVSRIDDGINGVSADPMAGLLTDVQHYAMRVQDEAQDKIGKLYEPVEDGEVVAWIWARTIRCASPACGAAIPLYSSPWLSKQQGREAWLKPVVEGRHVSFEIGEGVSEEIPAATKRSGGRGRFICLACGTEINEAYVRSAGAAGKMGIQMLAIAVDNDSGRHFLPEPKGGLTIDVEIPDEVPELEFANNTKQFSTPLYGLRRQGDIYTPRQLHMLGAFADAVAKVPDWVRGDGGDDDQAIAIGSILALCMSKLSQAHSSQSRWRVRKGPSKAEPAFGRQSIPMLWDFAEVNPFSGSIGSWTSLVTGIQRALRSLPRDAQPGVTVQADARKAGSLVPAGSALVATDPPYFAQIPYADLSDYFYVWLRRAARDLHPDLFGTMATPKTDELIANSYRHGGQEKARRYFIDGFTEAFSSLKCASRPDLPLIVIYAHRQEETKDGELTSSAWDALLEAMLAAGLSVVGTWPLHATNNTRQVGQGANVLASYVVMICRPRPDDAISTDRRSFLSALRRELPDRIKPLQQSSIPAVDLGQAAIGPGMEIFSRYAKVTEADGSPMRVRAALSEINKTLDELLSEYEDDFDADTRWCIKWFEDYQWGTADSGEADKRANRYNTSVPSLVHAGVIKSIAGLTELIKPADLPANFDPASDDQLTVWEVAMHLSRLLEGKGANSGIDGAGRFLARARSQAVVEQDTVRGLAYLLHSVAEQRGWTESQRWFNNLVSSWPDVQAAATAAERRGINSGESGDGRLF